MKYFEIFDISKYQLSLNLYIIKSQPIMKIRKRMFKRIKFLKFDIIAFQFI